MFMSRKLFLLVSLALLLSVLPGVWASSSIAQPMEEEDERGISEHVDDIVSHQGNEFLAKTLGMLIVLVMAMSDSSLVRIVLSILFGLLAILVEAGRR